MSPEMTGSGHEYAFSVPLNRVCHAVINRRSGSAVGNAAVGRPSHGARRTSILCHLPTSIDLSKPLGWAWNR